MKFSFLNKYPFSRIKPKTKFPRRPKHPKLPSGLQVEALENRLLLSVLDDFADEIIPEEEPNDLSYGQEVTFDIANEIYAVGIEAVLSSGGDVDNYNFDLSAGGPLELFMEATGEGDQGFTSLAAGPDNRAYFTNSNNVWVAWYQSAANGGVLYDLWAPRGVLADAANLSEEEVVVSDLAVTSAGEVLVTLSGSGDILSVDTGQDVSLIVTTEEITALTGQTVDLVSIAVDGEGVIYVADDVSGAVVQLTEDIDETYNPTYYASNADIISGLREEILDDITSHVSDTPLEVIAQAEEGTAFLPNSLVWGSGDYAISGYDVYYLTMLGAGYQGDGTVTRVLVNPDDPEDVIFGKFFDPEQSEVTSDEDLDPLTLNPSALVMDTSGDFGNQLYMGTFGPSLGDDKDGRIFVVDEFGDLTEFVTAYVDINGDPLDETGFFDITDMAFSQGFGFDNESEPYLYVLDENDSINSNGNFGSNLWRVDTAGVAELFVENITDRAISLAFGDLTYDGDMFIGTYGSVVGGAGSILRVDEEGTTSNFYTFNSPSFSVCDMAFAPADSLMEGELVFNLKGQTSTILYQFGPDTDQEAPVYVNWTNALNVGDVSSGDIVFTPSGNLVVANGGEENLTRVEYQTVLDYSLRDVQVRPVVYQREIPDTDPQEYEDVTVYTPYVFMENIGQPRIVGLGAAGESDDINTEVTPLTFGATTPDSESLTVAFTFDADGAIYVYAKSFDALETSSRNDEETPTDANPYVAGVFEDFSSKVSGTTIESNTGLLDSVLTQIAWSPGGYFFSLGSNGTEPQEEGGDPPSQVLDDVLLLLGDTLEDSWSPDTWIGVSELNPLQVSVSGPDEFSYVYDFVPGTIFNEKWEGEELARGVYVVSVSHLINADTQFDYELVISIGEETDQTIVINEDTGTWTLTNTDNDQLRISYTGMGQVTVDVVQKPNGKVISIPSVSVTGSFLTSELNMVMMDDNAQWVLDDVLLGGSLGMLRFAGTIDTLRAESTTFGIVKEAQLGEVHNVDAPLCYFWDFQARSLGQAEVTGQVFNALSLRNLDVVEDIANVQFFNSSSNNIYRDITVGGVIEGSTFYGAMIDTLLVENRVERADAENPNTIIIDIEDTAINDSTFALSETVGSLRQILVQDGDVINCAFYMGQRLGKLEIVNGNFEDSIVYATGYISRIGEVIVSRAEGTADEDAGNITGSQIRSTGWLQTVRADGAVSAESQIVASGTLISRIGTISTGGDFAGVISSSGWVYSVVVGFDADGKRIAENEDYTGADFTGTLYGYTGIMKFSVTGSIADASIITSVGSIFTIYAEDGLTDTTIQAGQMISRIMVGFINGFNSYYYIANYQADVSGSISAYYLGSLYYTGFTNTQNPNVLDVRSVVRTGIIKDKIADITVADISLNEGSSGQSKFSFTVTLSQVTPAPVILNYTTVDGTATDGADSGEDNDYVAASGQLIIPAGWISRTIDVSVNADRKYELDENFKLQLSQPAGMVVFAYLLDNQAEATVENDDSAPQLSINSVSRDEGDSGTTAFTFEISPTAGQLSTLPVTVEYATEDGTASELTDYEYVEDEITFEPNSEGELSKINITVLVTGDTQDEEDETFEVILFNPTNATIDTENGTGTGTILNDD